MHGTAEATGKTGFLGIDFGKGTIEYEILCQVPYGISGEMFLDNLVSLATHEILHDGNQVAVFHLPDGREALCQNFTMTAVGTENLVFRIEHHGLAYRCRLLAG